MQLQLEVALDNRELLLHLARTKGYTTTLKGAPET